MTLSATFQPADSRVLLQATSLGAVTLATFWSRLSGTLTWTQVRGAIDVPVAGGTSAPVLDYEFPVTGSTAATVEYAVTAAGGVDQRATVSVSVADECWLKFPGFPFLNLPLQVIEPGTISRNSRGSLLPIASARGALAVQEFMSGRGISFTVRTTTWADYVDLDAALSLGSIVFLHADEARLGLPAMYGVVNRLTSDKAARRHGETRYTVIGVDEVAKPSPFYAGAVGTWQSVLTGYDDWDEVATTYSSWNDLLLIEGSPSDVVVG